MESVLNEFSVDDLASNIKDARGQMKKLLQLCKSLKENYGFTKLRLPN
jgi:hypothetical protein